MIARIIEGSGKTRRSAEVPLANRSSTAEGLCKYMGIQPARK